MTTFHDLEARRLDGAPTKLSAYKGKVLVVVNTASECGYTPQYAGLQKLHDELKSKGVEVLGFPSNDFGGQEPGTAEQIAAFCSTKFHVDFPLFEKVATVGPEQHPVYRFLSADRGAPKWNFRKYVVSKDGKVVAAFPSSVKPDSPELKKAIDDALAAR